MLKLSLPLQTNAWLTPLIVLLTSVIVFLLPESVSDTLVFDRTDIENGQWWRIFTGHFDHTNFNHLLLNLAGLIMLWALHGDHYRHGLFTGVFLISVITTSLGIYYFDTDMNRYVGLSGVLHGVFVFGAIADIRGSDKTGYLLLIGIIAKIIYEQVAGASEDMVDLIGASVAIDAHLFGAIGGLIAGLIWLAITKSKSPKPS
ncbi:rhombosortase [Thalassotalea sp. PS06]|uniref:rhombosortase n=1 Tax=Thalassotalea sp. PS06 TaxID=2594005 RepID=UPI001161C866|nr:rhombosortase [Thalassotalea sp. PS06]QDP01066.1 rhombosortase [Thalassotalea sp. PS06]